MNIMGIQKTSMVDYPGLLCATLFTPGCNFRCPFCHNGSLVLNTTPEEQTSINIPDLLAFLKERKGRLDAVCISGGEPLLQRDISDFLLKIREMGYRIKLDTNGSFPERLENLISSGLLDYVAMDIKNSPQRYAQTVGLPALDLGPIFQSIALLKENRVDYEFRTTVSATFHDEESLKKAGEMIRGAEIWYLQGYKDSAGVIDRSVVGYDKNELSRLCKLLHNYAKTVIIRGI